MAQYEILNSPISSEVVGSRAKRDVRGPACLVTFDSEVGESEPGVSSEAVALQTGFPETMLTEQYRMHCVISSCNIRMLPYQSHVIESVLYIPF